MRVLQRTVLRETLLLGGFYGAAFLGLIVAGVATPLLKQGAPIGAVIGFLPDQLLLLSIVALPLAMVTAFLAVIGRMREDGELTALMAAGVGTWQVAKATLPVALLVAAWLGIASHLLLPGLSLRALQGRDEVLRQAIGAQVERRTPVMQQGDQLLAANAVRDDRLIGLFGVQVDEHGGIGAVFAPEARWVSQGGEGDAQPSLGLEMQQARMLMVDPGPEGRVSTAIVPRLSVRIPQGRGSYTEQADALSTGELWARIHGEPMSATEEKPAAQPGTDPPEERRSHYASIAGRTIGPLAASQVRTLEERAKAGRLDAKELATIEMKSRRFLRSLERTWHLRFMLPVACLSFWAFACGLGFTIGRGSRMVAVCLGVVTVVATLFPSFVLAKEIGEKLAIDAAVWVWPPAVIVGLIGAWLLWRQR